MKSVVRHTKKVILTVVGITVIAIGIALLVLPGPGWLVIIAGLGILATEYVWARKVLEKAKEQASKGANAVGAGLRGVIRRKAAPVPRSKALSTEDADLGNTAV